MIGFVARIAREILKGISGVKWLRGGVGRLLSLGCARIRVLGFRFGRRRHDKLNFGGPGPAILLPHAQPRSSVECGARLATFGLDV